MFLFLFLLLLYFLLFICFFFLYFLGFGFALFCLWKITVIPKSEKGTSLQVYSSFSRINAESASERKKVLLPKTPSSFRLSCLVFKTKIVQNQLLADLWCLTIANFSNLFACFWPTLLSFFYFGWGWKRIILCWFFFLVGPFCGVQSGKKLLITLRKSRKTSRNSALWRVDTCFHFLCTIILQPRIREDHKYYTFISIIFSFLTFYHS